MHEVIVRPARPDDLEGLLTILVELGDWSDEPPPVNPIDPRGVLAAIMADPARTLIVAVRGEEVLGTADVLIAPNLTHLHRPWATVENVVVTESARRSGVGRMVMERAIEIAREAGCYKVQLMSGKQRLPAHVFYESLGFEPIAEGFKLSLL